MNIWVVTEEISGSNYVKALETQEPTTDQYPVASHIIVSPVWATEVDGAPPKLAFTKEEKEKLIPNYPGEFSDDDAWTDPRS